MSFAFIGNAKKPLNRILCILLAYILTASCCLTASARSSLLGKTLRVGLYYGSGAVATANLSNYEGSGFSFGYFDADNDFVELGQTDETAITMLKDKNLYLSGDAYYETPTSSAYSLVGAYHVELEGSYPDYDSARDAADGTELAFPAYVNGEFVVRVDYFSTEDNARQYADENFPGAAVVGGSATCVTVAKMGTNEIIFEYDDGGASYLGVMPREKNDEPVTWFKGYKYYGGFRYSRASGNDLTVVNFVDVDDYVKGVIPYEMSADWELEALKAQAVCARTFACVTTKHASLGFDVCNTTNCQVYRGVYTGENSDNVNRAVDETAGEGVYYDGELISAVYHSSDGGATESSENTWGTEHPYLVGVIDPYEAKVDFKNKSWSYEYTLDDFAALLNAKGYSCSGVLDAYVESYTDVGNVDTLVFIDSDGKRIAFSGDDARSLMEQTDSARYFSRRFTIIKPGATYNEDYTAAVGTDSTAMVYINDSSEPVSVSGLYVIGDSGTTKLSGTPAAITADGEETVSGEAPTTGSESGTVKNTSGKYLIIGGGWGHNVGMSQYGAKGMAIEGFTYDEIIRFYYTGVEIK